MNRTAITGALLVLGATLAMSVDWPMHGLDPARTRSTAEPIAPPLAVAWSAAFGEDFFASPVTAEGFVVAASMKRTIRALREDTGAIAWTKPMPGDLLATPAVDAGRVYVPCGDGTLYCLDLISGTTIWTAPMQRTAYASPTLAGGALYLSDGFRSLVSVDPATGSTLWSTELDQMPYGTPCVSGGAVYVGTTSGACYSLDAATGAVNWTFATAGQFFFSSPLALGPRVWAFPGTGDSTMYGLNATTGSLETAVGVSDPSAPPAVEIMGMNVSTGSPMAAGGLVVAAVRFDYWRDTDGDFVKDTFTMNEYAIGVDPATGALAWQTTIGAKSTADELEIPLLGSLSTPCGMSGGLYTVAASSIDPNLRVLNPLTGATLDTVAVGAPSRSSPAATNARVVHATDAGTVWALQGSVNAPPNPVASGFNPAGGAQNLDGLPTFAWDAAVDATDGPATLKYLFRLDDDGEVLRDWDVEVQTGWGVQTATVPAPLAWYAQYFWAVRAEDDEGARGPWSAMQDFWVHQPPAPVTGLVAIPGNQLVQLQWTASVGPNVAYYNLYVDGAGPTNIGNVTTRVVAGLNNGQTYTFGISAVDVDGDEGAIATASAAPTAAAPTVALNGTPMLNLTTALTQATPGSFIQLGAGWHVAPNGATLNGISIWGENARDTIVVGVPPGPVFTTVGDSEIQRVTITGGDSGVLVNAGNLLLQNVIVRDHPDAGVRMAGGSSTINLTTILNNAVVGVDALTGGVTLTNSILANNGIGLQMVMGQTHEYNDYFGNGAAITGGVPTVTEWTFAVAFENPAANDYREVAGSKTIDLGRPGDAFDLEPEPNGGRVNMGAFGNTELATKSAGGQNGNGGGGGGGGGGGCGMSVSGASTLLPWLLGLLGAVLLSRRRL